MILFSCASELRFPRIWALYKLIISSSSSSNTLFSYFRQINNLELKAFKFTPFGKDFIKSQKLSPDAFVQVNLQLAYYR